MLFHTHIHTNQSWGSLVVTGLHNTTGKNTRISCIGLLWGNGWIWWSTVKMSKITAFLPNEMLTLQNAWFYTAMQRDLKMLFQWKWMRPFCPRRCREGLSGTTQKIRVMKLNQFDMPKTLITTNVLFPYYLLYGIIIRFNCYTGIELTQWLFPTFFDHW